MLRYDDEKIAVIGSRNFSDYALIKSVLYSLKPFTLALEMQKRLKICTVFKGLD